MICALVHRWLYPSMLVSRGLKKSWHGVGMVLAWCCDSQHQHHSPQALTLLGVYPSGSSSSSSSSRWRAARLPLAGFLAESGWLAGCDCCRCSVSTVGRQAGRQAGRPYHHRGCLDFLSVVVSQLIVCWQIALLDIDGLEARQLPSVSDHTNTLDAPLFSQARVVEREPSATPLGR